MAPGTEPEVYYRGVNAGIERWAFRFSKDAVYVC